MVPSTPTGRDFSSLEKGSQLIWRGKFYFGKLVPFFSWVHTSGQVWCCAESTSWISSWHLPSVFLGFSAGRPLFFAAAFLLVIVQPKRQQSTCYHSRVLLNVVAELQTITCCLLQVRFLQILLGNNLQNSNEGQFFILNFTLQWIYQHSKFILWELYIQRVRNSVTELKLDISVSLCDYQEVCPDVYGPLFCFLYRLS